MGMMWVGHVTRIIENYSRYDVTQCGLVVYICFGGSDCFHLQDCLASSANKHQAKPFYFADSFQVLFFDAEEERSVFLRNVGNILPDYMASCSRGQNSS
jgi:hypothetical protein